METGMSVLGRVDIFVHVRKVCEMKMSATHYTASQLRMEVDVKYF